MSPRDGRTRSPGEAERLGFVAAARDVVVGRDDAGPAVVK